MGKYFIEEVKCDPDGATDPDPISIVSTIKFREGSNGQSRWMIMTDTNGIIMVFVVPEDWHEKFLCLNDEDNRFFEENAEKYICHEFDGIRLEYKCLELVRNLVLAENQESAALLRYVLAVNWCDWDDQDEIITAGVGHYADEEQVPKVGLNDIRPENAHLSDDIEADGVADEVRYDPEEVHPGTSPMGSVNKKFK